MEKYSFCPQCQIGLNSKEMQLGFCQNCKHNWDNEEEFDDEDGFQCCDNCDLPDACADFGCAIKTGVRKDPEDFMAEKLKSISESIFNGRTNIIPMADVQHIEKCWYSSDEITKDNYRGIKVITNHTRWDIESDAWANNIYLDRQEGDAFLKAWCVYRHEIETFSNQ